MANQRGQGRKPLPKNIKIARGTDKHHPSRLNDLEPEAPSGRPVCPDHFDRYARAEWERVSDILDDLGQLSPAYVAMLEIYCYSFGKMRLAEEQVDRLGVCLVVREGDRTVVRRNQFATEAHKYRDTCYRLLSEFGLSPSAKTRLIDERKNQPTSKWAQFLSGANSG